MITGRCGNRSIFRGRFRRSVIGFSVVLLSMFVGFDTFSRNLYAAAVTVCDSGCNYSTISAALTAVGDGNHTITVQSPFTQSASTVTTINRSGASASSRLTLQGRAGDTISVGSFYVTGNYVTIRNFVFRGTATHCAEIANGVSYVDIDGNTFNCNSQGISSFRMPITLPVARFVNYTNNKINNSGYPQWVGGNNILYANNVHDGNVCNLNYNPTTGYTYDAMWVFGDNVIVRGNEIKNLYDLGGNHVDFVQTAGNAIPDTGATNILIENNFWHDGEAQLCNLSNYPNSPNYNKWTWRNNVFKNIRYRCNTSLPDMKFYNNVFDNVDWDPLHGQGGAIMAANGSGGDSCINVEIKNNLSVGRLLYLPITECVNGVADYNFSTSYSYTPITLGMYSKETHGINGGDPKFVNRSANNYHLQPGSVAIDAGVTVSSFSWDMSGISRPQGIRWDIGPFEGQSNLKTPYAPGQIEVK